jgi:hypothetical protein
LVTLTSGNPGRRKREDPQPPPVDNNTIQEAEFLNSFLLLDSEDKTAIGHQ